MTTGRVCIGSVTHAVGFCSTYKPLLPSQVPKSPFGLTLPPNETKRKAPS
ncbi:hypothetical protein [Paenibacillus glycanilyticus]|nr:hypothetical protein [Paenibacillus glycanilyticus]